VRARALLGVLVAVVGCQDFTLVDPDAAPQPTAPVMFIGLRVDQTETSNYALDASFFRGLDTRGRLNEFTDPTLGVDGSAVQPTADAQQGWWRYTSAWMRADQGGQPDSVRVRPPVSVGPQAPELMLTIPVAARGDAADVTWAEGTDLRLRVTPAPLAPRLRGTASNWTLELADSCGLGSTSRLLTVQGSGSFPAELRLPWEWLPNAAPAAAAACLRVFSLYEVANAPYRIDVVVQQQLTWRLHIRRSGQ